METALYPQAHELIYSQYDSFQNRPAKKAVPDGYMTVEEFRERAKQHIRKFAKENGLY